MIQRGWPSGLAKAVAKMDAICNGQQPTNSGVSVNAEEMPTGLAIYSPVCAPSNVHVRGTPQKKNDQKNHPKKQSRLASDPGSQGELVGEGEVA